MDEGALRGEAEIPPCEPESNPATALPSSSPSSSHTTAIGTKRSRQLSTNSDASSSSPQNRSAAGLTSTKAHAQRRRATLKMAIDQRANELLSAQKSADSGLQVVLHPLPLLEISDSITRGYMRNFKGAIVGALLGQQNGRLITIEHSFSCKAEKQADGFYKLDEEWFKDRLLQSRPC
jgi:hypothetical protein